MSWHCPVCGEGYPSADNAGVPREGAIILVYKKDLDALRPHLPQDAVVHLVIDEGES